MLQLLNTKMLNHSIIGLFVLSIMPTNHIQGTLHPTQSVQKTMRCEEFGRTARFNPYSVLDETWFVFYSWGKPTSRQYKFYFPTSKERNFIKLKLQNVTIPVNWTAPAVIMKDLQSRMSFYIVQRSDRGLFWKYPFQIVRKDGRKIEPVEILLKQVCDSKFIGFMNCETDEVFALSHITQIPKKIFLKDAAATIGYRGRGGRSYLYQGHHWMPIEEDDEEEYWRHPDEHRRRQAALDSYAVEHPDVRPTTPKSSLFEASKNLAKNRKKPFP